MGVPFHVATKVPFLVAISSPSPRVRGELAVPTTAACSERPIPARAGQRTAPAAPAALATVHPRVRGAVPMGCGGRHPNQGSSPRLRGPSQNGGCHGPTGGSPPWWGSVDGPRAAAGLGFAVPPAGPETLPRALLTPYNHGSRGAAGAARLLRPARRLGALEEAAGGLHQHAGVAGAAGGLPVVAALTPVPVRARREMPASVAPPLQAPRAGTAGAAARARHNVPQRLELSVERVRGGGEARVRALDDRPGYRRGAGVGVGDHD